jgi:hypothetical protein
MSRTAKKKMKKTFDCIAFKRKAQRRLMEETKDMSEDQRRAHVRKIVESGPLADFWEQVKQRAKTAPRAGRL